jgi:hypothetical protein
MLQVFDVAGLRGDATTEDERQRTEDEEYEEQDLRDPGCTGGDPAETEHGGNESDDEEDGGPIEHDK